jgi:hypothetical protein
MGTRKLRKLSSILTINRTGTGQHSAIWLQLCNPCATNSPPPNGKTLPLALGMGLLPEMHHGDKRGKHPLYSKGTGYGTRVLVEL